MDLIQVMSDTLGKKRDQEKAEGKYDHEK